MNVLHVDDQDVYKQNHFPQDQTFDSSLGTTEIHDYFSIWLPISYMSAWNTFFTLYK